MIRLWCRLFHRNVRHPFRGEYACRCGLRWPAWQEKGMDE